MQKAYFKNILSIIRKNKISYIAIMMFVFFSMHMYLMLSYAVEDLYMCADRCYQNYRKYDVAAYLTNGLDDSIVEEIKKIRGTNDVETAHISYGYLETNDGKLDTEVRTLTDEFALPLEVEGRLPMKSNEVALLKHFAKKYNIRIGETITIKDNMYLQEEDFVVSALFESSQYMEKKPLTYGYSKITGNTNSSIAFVNKDALNNNYVQDNYIMMKNNFLSGLSRFSSEYKKICEDYIKKIDESLDTILTGDYIIEKWDEEIGYFLLKDFTNIPRTVYKTLVPILFLVVIMVLITSMSRMILEQKNEINIMKANGFTNKEIARIFYIYSISATIFGLVLANILATFFTEKLIINVVSNHIVLEPGPYMFDIKKMLLSFVLPTVIMIFTTYMCIKKVLNMKEINILQVKKTTSTKTYFYEHFLLFKKLPIFSQIIINNFIKDVRRCSGIVFAIIGSVMLLTAGIIIDRNVYNGYESQMRNDIRFDTMLFFNPLSSASDEIEVILKENNINYALCQYANLILNNPHNDISFFTFFIYDDREGFSKLYKLDAIDKSSIKRDGLYLQESYKNKFGLHERGHVKVKKMTEEYIHQRVTQYFHNYIVSMSLAAIDKETYEDRFDAKSYMQTYIIDTKNHAMDSIYKKLVDVDGYLYHFDYIEYLKSGFLSIYSFINLIVGIFIITSILFSFLIVLNLMKINLIERKSELIILVINGFRKREIKNYVLLDMFLMIVIGNAIGLVLGLIIGTLVLNSLNNDLVYYMNTINPKAVFFSLTISLVINIIITRLSIIEIEKMDIVV